MKAQRLAWSLGRHASTPSSILFHTTCRAASHRAWLTASSIRYLHQNPPKSRSREAAEEIEPASDESEPISSFIHRTPTQSATVSDPPDLMRDIEPILPPPAPTEDKPKFGAPRNLQRRQISDRNAQIAALMGTTKRGANRSPRNASDAESSALFYNSLRSQPTPTSRKQGEQASLWLKSMEMGVHERAEVPPPVRLDAFMGRAAIVNRTTQPLGRALSALGATMRQNAIKEQHFSQRFHERPGLKRKRLRSSRWRKRFMVGFKHMVNKVREMKAQGW